MCLTALPGRGSRARFNQCQASEIPRGIKSCIVIEMEENCSDPPQVKEGPILSNCASLTPWYRADPQAALRTFAPPEQPLRRAKLPSGAMAWILTDFQLARSLLADRRFSKEIQCEQATQGHFIFRHMLFCDPPEHTRLRGLVTRFFLKTTVQKRRLEIQSTSDRRGQDGVRFLLSCKALSSSTTSRFIPARPQV